MCINADGSKPSAAAGASASGSTAPSGSQAPATSSQSPSKASTQTISAGLMLAAAFCAAMVAM